MAQPWAARYRARNPRATPLYQLFETHFDEVRGQWEERLERRCGFWRGFVDEQVRRYLDCGLSENGFAHIRCPDCAEEYLLAFSCKTRELYPSCGSEMGVIVFITEHDVVDAILRALERKGMEEARAPPGCERVADLEASRPGARFAIGRIAVEKGESEVRWEDREKVEGRCSGNRRDRLSERHNRADSVEWKNGLRVDGSGTLEVGERKFLFVTCFKYPVQLSQFATNGRSLDAGEKGIVFACPPFCEFSVREEPTRQV